MQAVETVFLACKKGRRKMRIVWSQLFSKPNLMTLPSMAISPWVFDYFISEMTDCTQQQKIPSQARLVPGCRRFLPLLSPAISHSVKINFHKKIHFLLTILPNCYMI